MLAPRVAGYDPKWLDELCLSGEVAWGRLTPRPDAAPEPGAAPGRRGSSTPSPATPLALVLREDLGWQMAAVRAGDGPLEPAAGASADVLATLRGRGACFRSELAAASGRLPGEVDEGLWDLVARGLVTADAFSAVRSLLSARQRWRARQRRGPFGPPGPWSAAGRPIGSGLGEGRWALLPDPPGPPAVPRWRPGGGGRGRAGRGGGLAAAGPMGRRGLRGVVPRVVPAPLAPRSCGPCGAWRRAGWPSGEGSWPGCRGSSTPRPRPRPPWPPCGGRPATGPRHGGRLRPPQRDRHRPARTTGALGVPPPGHPARRPGGGRRRRRRPGRRLSR